MKTKKLKRKIPDEWKGPFTVGQYNKYKAALYLKRPNGKVQAVYDVFPCMFIDTHNKHKIPILPKSSIVKRIKEKKYIRYLLNPEIKRDEIDKILDLCNDADVNVYEADVDPIRRWFSDTGAEVHPYTTPLFYDIESKPLKPGFDNDAKKEHMIISFSYQDMEMEKPRFIYNHTCDEKGEKKLIKRILKIFSRYDTLLAWNGKDYDFYVLRWRCRRHSININWRNWNCLDYMLTVKKCLMSISDPTFKRSFNLNNIGYNVLGIKKLDLKFDMTKLDQLILNGRVKELKEYNNRDVELMTLLEKKREFFGLHSAVCSICRKFPDNNSLYPNTLADGLMLRIGVTEKTKFKSRYSQIEDGVNDKYTGAYVMDAKLGYHEQIQVIDFSSLYPSIMITWNMSPETKIIKGQEDKYPEEVLRNHLAFASASGEHFRNDFEGILPKTLRILIETRKEYSRKQKEATIGSQEWKRYGHESTAIKVVANSMYGLLGSKYTRYYDVDIASSVTKCGQMLIKECIKYSEDNGVEVIAGDTDSCFVKADEETTKKLIEEINNELLPNMLNKLGCKINRISMDFDKGYKYLLIQAKKKYAGILSLHKGKKAPDDIEPDIKGLEFQRSDNIKYAQKMQMEYVKILLQPKITSDEVETLLRESANSFMNDDIDVEDIIITQAVKKHPKDYSTMTPAVKVAADMIKNGIEFYVGMKVPYIITSSKGGIRAIHADKYDGKFDRIYYWTKKVFPLVERLVRVRFPNQNFREIDTLIKSPNQFTFDFTGRLPIKNEPKLPSIKKR